MSITSIGTTMADRRWTILLLAFAARGATGYQFQSVASTTQMLAEHYQVGFSDIGLLLGVYMLPGVVVAYATGRLGQRYREDQLCLVGLSLMIGSGIGIGLSDHLLMGLAFRITGGIGATVVIITVTKMIADWFNGREIVLAMSVVQVSWPIGAMLGLPLQTALAETFGLMTAMLSTGIVAVIVLAAFVLRYAPLPQSDVRQAASTSLSLSSRAPIIVAGAIWGAMNVACIVVFTSAPQVLQAQGLSATTAAAMVGAIVLLTIISIPAGGYLVQWLRRTTVAIAFCATMAALSLALFAMEIWPAAACVLFGLAIGPLSGSILVLPSLVLDQEQRAAGFGLFYSVFYLLMVAGPACAGYLQDQWQRPEAPIVFASVLLSAIPFMLLLFVRLKRRHDTGVDAAGILTPLEAQSPN
ncbi:hypothetical protein X566_17065 [Afipia sp. P52-10]|uniref:MFS transporter n=1 Tax=Afipia sp. P52-10 TaxID=1429916 RepID=UPI0003DF3FF3|nr:MFS transporter [Afipia sp. P52-10]ETR76426.1 hypothetical protein X566_17065 [Afipia sp. P52-10]